MSSFVKVGVRILVKIEDHLINEKERLNLKNERVAQYLLMRNERNQRLLQHARPRIMPPTHTFHGQSRLKTKPCYF